jgi:hypothetical protein
MGATSGVLVVIGFAEALSAPEVAWSLVDAGFSVIAFSRKGRRAALRHSRHAKVFDITAPEDDLAAALYELAAVIDARACEYGGQVVVLPIDDASLWLCNRVRPASQWVLSGPSGNCAELALDKQKQLAAAAASGLAVPPTSTTVDAIARSAARYPVILRPASAILMCDGRLRKGRNWICADDEELRRAQAALSATDTLLVQPYLEGTGEGVFGLATDNGVIAWSAHRRLRMMNPHGSGSSACISQAVPHDLKARVAAFVKSCEWRGMFMVELLRTEDGRPWFVEFNGRAWGSMALARRLSLEYPAWTVKLALEPHFRPATQMDGAEGVVCRNLGREFMHLLFVVRGPQSRAVRTWPSLVRTLIDLLRINRQGYFYNWRKEDWRVFVSDCWYTIRDQVFKVR